ncbi:unnamed protein product [Didymodactylos carnosus]|uniref:Uncharacterized protein n=1 Tax=Didymodactylos carnosus TaxID=1234261 RepID=A0A8S2PI34_9BILA|nr:unnamed protein product [Didymodactylos carnosus]CAF4049890.1 unnamed protein product [Didymodactylos carnosus]
MDKPKHVPAASTTTNINMTTPDNEVQHNYIVPSNQSKTYETITTNEKSIDKHDMSQSHPQSHEISDSDIYIMDANLKGNVSRFFNHSCSPNVFVQNVFIETYDVRFPWVAFFTSANVKAGTELCWDYQYEVGSVEDRVLSCQCGATNCRSRLL